MFNLPDHISAGMDSAGSDKLGQIAAEIASLQKNGMPPNQIPAYLEKQMNEMPGMIPFKNAYALYNYLKSHPVTPPAPNPDSTVVGMAKQIAAQDVAKKMAAMPMGAPPMAPGMGVVPPMRGAAPQMGTPPEGPTATARHGGLADLDAHNIGKDEHYAAGGIVAFGAGDLVSAQPLTEEEQQELARLNNIQQPISTFGRFGGESMLINPNSYTNEQLSNIPALAKRRDELISKQQAYTVAQQSQTDQDRLTAAAAARGITLPTPVVATAATTPSNTPTTNTPQLQPGQLSPEDLNLARSFYHPPGGGSIQAGVGGSGDKQPQPPYPEVAQAYTPDSIEKTYDGLMGLKEKYGLGKATKAYDEFLDTQQAKLDANTKWAKSMELAKFGFGLASTPGPTLAAIGARGADATQGLLNIRQQQQAAENNIAKSKLEGAKAIEQENLGMLRDSVIGHRADSQFASQMNSQQNMLQMERERTASSERTAALHTQMIAGVYKPQQQLASLQSAATQGMLAGRPDIAKFYTDQIAMYSGLSPSVLAAGSRNDSTQLSNFMQVPGVRNLLVQAQDPKADPADRAKAQAGLRSLVGPYAQYGITYESLMPNSNTIRNPYAP